MQQPPTQTLAKDTKIKQSEAIDGSNAALASDSVEWRDISTNHVDSNPKGSEISKSTIADEKTVSNRIKSRSGSSLTRLSGNRPGAILRVAIHSVWE
jgi:hypothetical protein